MQLRGCSNASNLSIYPIVGGGRMVEERRVGGGGYRYACQGCEGTHLAF